MCMFDSLCVKQIWKQTGNLYMVIIGIKLQRQDLGLPESWEKIQSWIDDSRDVESRGEEEHMKVELKNPEIPPLGDYTSDPGSAFWDKFPKNFPRKTCQSVNRKKLKMYVNKWWAKWELPKRNVAKDALNRLKGKIETKFVKNL